MKIKLEDLKEIDKGLLKRIMDEIESDQDLEDVSVVIDGNTYTFFELEKSGWESDSRGKYSTQEITYVLVLCNDEDWVEIERYNVILTQSVSRTGSYYSDYYYEYEDFSLQQACEQIVPEQIIPAHTVIGLKALEI